MEITSSVKKGIGWTTFTRASYEFIHLIQVPILARLLEPQDFGIYGIALMIEAYMENIEGFGLLPALIQRKEIRSDHISTIFSISFVIGIFFYIILFFSSSYIGEFFNNAMASKVICVLSISLLLRPFADLPLYILQRDLKFKKYSLVMIARNFITTIFSIIFAFWGFKIWSLVIGNLSGLLIQILILFSLRIWIPKFKYSHKAMKELFSFSSWMFLQNQLSYISKNIDFFFVGKFLGAISLGFYERAFSIMMLPYRRIVKSISSVVFPAFSRIEDDTNYLISAVRKLILSISFLGYPIMTGLMIIAPEFVQIVLGPKWLRIIVPLRILCVAGIFNFLGGFLMSVVTSRGMAKELATRDFLSTGFLTGGVIIGCYYGIEGVSAAAVLYSLLRVLLLASLLISRTQKMNWFDFLSPQFPPSLASLGMLGIILILKLIMFKMKFYSQILFLSTSIIFGAIAYLGIIFMIKSPELSFLKKEIYKATIALLEKLNYKKRKRDKFNLAISQQPANYENTVK